jgi:citrate lyase subunit beta/citryl-CoA lyase
MRVPVSAGESEHRQRSWLLVAASGIDDVAAAAESGADIVVLDLVELVAAKDKPAARAALRRSIEALAAAGVRSYAQVDRQFLAGDIEAAAWPGLSGIVISRIERAEEVREAAWLLECFEKERDIEAGTLRIVAALETAQGNHGAHDILSASERVSGATLGRADLIMDLRPEPSNEIHLMPYLMQRLIIVAGAAGVTPIGAWWRAPDRGLLATPENTYKAAQRGRAIGFKGAMCLGTNQVGPLNEAFG